VPVAHDVPFLQGSLYDTATYYVEEGGTSVSGNVMEASPSTYTNSWNADEVGADAQISLTGLEYYDGSTNSWEPVPGNGKAMYGTISMTENGDFTYVPDPYSNHPAPDHLMDKFRYTIEDADGDQDQAEFGVVVADTEVTVTTAPIAGIDEASLSSGSDPSPVQPVAVTGSIEVEHQDPVDVKSFEFDPSTTIINGSETFDDLTSGGERIYYALSEDEAYITAYTYGGTGEPSADYVPPVSDYVFTLEIDTTVSGDPGYEFTLYKPLDHTDDISVDDPIEGRQIVLPFEFQIFEPDDHDKAQSVLNIKVLDDASAASKDVEVLEDQSITFTTNADGSPSNITITTEPSYGNYVVNADGTITYNPSEHFSGQDLLKYTYTNDNGTVSTEKTVSITVKPVADAPDVMDDYGITTTEDTPVALGLTAPVVTDDTDTYGAGVTGDDPERLGLITVSGIPEGAKVFKADGTLIFTGTSTDDDFTVQLDETGTDSEPIHINGVSGEVVLSIAEFNALRILPPADDATDFTVKMRVTEYEVDASGNPVNAPTDTNGETAETEVTVEVRAVTDRVDLKWIDGADESPYDQADPADDDTFGTVPDSMDEIKDTVEDGTLNKYIDEGDTLNLSQLLAFNANDPVVDHTDLTTIEQNGDDDDGSEDRWLVLDDLPAGFVVTAGGSSISPENDGTYIIPLVNNDNDLPSIIISPPSDFSGEVTDYSIALYTKDTDADTTVTTVEKSDEVSLNLYIMPQAGDVSAPDVSTSEDTPVKFLENLVVTDTSDGVGNGGLESITSITVSNVPAGWVIRDGSDAIVSDDGSGNYTIDVDAYTNYTITPPAHSSADGTVTVSVTTEDSAIVDGSMDTDTKTTDLDISIEVSPVAERIGTDSDEDGQTDDISASGDQAIADTDENGTADLQMNPSHTYQKEVLEDNWFDLSSDGQNFELKNGWDNEDADEDTYALMTPKGWDPEGNEIELSGSEFRYTVGGDEVVKQFTADPIAIPVNALGTLEFLATPNYAGEVVITVNALTVDRDDDQEGNPSALMDQKITGETELSLTILPESDLTSINTYSPGGDEDTLIPLYIRPVTEDQDGSEIIEITINGLPEGAELYYGGTEIRYKLELNGPSGDGTYSVTIGDVDNGQSFDPAAPLLILPPDDSNEDFINEISIVGTSNDSGGSNSEATVILGDIDTIPVKVDVRGVADGAVVGLDAESTTVIEGEVDADQNRISLEGLIDTVTLKDEDGSEKLSLIVKGVPAGIDLEGDGVTYIMGSGEDRIWTVSGDADSSAVENFNKASFIVPEHYSGTFRFQVTPVTTENDGDSMTGPQNPDPAESVEGNEPISLTVHVTPTTESTVSTSTGVAEDTLTQVDFSFSSNGDSDESLDWVEIDKTSLDGKRFTLFYYDTDAGGSPLMLDQAVSDGLITETVSRYHLEGDALGHIYALADADHPVPSPEDGDYTFIFSYQVTDPDLSDVGGDDVTITENVDYSLNVLAITDPVDVEAFEESKFTFTNTDAVYVVPVEGDPYVSVTGNTIVTLDVTVRQVDRDGEPVDPSDTNTPSENGADVDGTEVLDRLIIDGIPEGVTVGVYDSNGVFVMATYVGNTVDGDGNALQLNRWIVDVDEQFMADSGNPDGSVTVSVAFALDGSSTQLSDLDELVTITAESRDSGSVVVRSAENWLLKSDGFTEGDMPDDYPEDEPLGIDSIVMKAQGLIEDTPMSLDELITVSLDDNDEPTSFSLVITNPPEGTVISGMENMLIDPDGDGPQEPVTIYTASTSGTYEQLLALMQSIEVTPPVHSNDNNNPDGFQLDVTLTTYAPGGGQSSSSLEVGLPVDPRTDESLLSIDVPDSSEEDQAPDITFSVSLQPGVDTADFTTFVDGNLYLKVDDGAMDAPGKVFFGEEEASIATNIPPQLGSGTFYVVPGVSMDTTYDFTYHPEEHASGSVSVEAFLLTREYKAPETDVMLTAAESSFSVAAVNDGYDMAIADQDESDVDTTVIGDEDEKILIPVTGEGLIDTDGSENALGVVLENVPDGYLVFTGSADDPQLAANLGNGAGGSNIWSIALNPNGSLPPIYIEAPENVSGRVEDIKLTVYTSDRGEMNDPASSLEFDLVVDPVADPLELLTPTLAFGTEGERVSLNLNAGLEDMDGSETVSATFAGVGPYAAFYDNDGEFIESVAYDEETDTYTLRDIPVYDEHEGYDINNINVVQSARYVDSVDVSAWTVENDDPENPSSEMTGKFVLAIDQEESTENDDVLLYDSGADRMYDGLGGDDTLLLRDGYELDGGIRQGDDLDFGSGPALRNIEVIDMHNHSANEVQSLSAQDVLDITDGDNEIYILGDNAASGHQDKVELDSASGWTQQAGGPLTENITYGGANQSVEVYTYTNTDNDAVLKIEAGVAVL
ncbi:hypothetical protein INT02_06665, partial [Prosthecochloris sp. N2]|nr:hypothetical protein [Prosthecochloris ethylica]NUK48642.1 hypothetical protein [Prosthecochloris ethylica]